METQLVNRYVANMRRVLSCYDRILITGTLPRACYAGGMTSFLYSRGIRIFDYAQFAEPLRDRIRARAHSTVGVVAPACTPAHVGVDQKSGSYLSLLPHAPRSQRHRRSLFNHPLQHHSCHGRNTINSSQKMRKHNLLDRPYTRFDYISGPHSTIATEINTFFLNLSK